MLLSYKTRLINKKLLTSNVYLFTFSLLDPLEINFIPGQYLILKVNKHPRLYSIYSSNKIKNQIEFIVGIIPGGLASTYFLNLKVGDQTEFQGPLGQFVLRENANKKIFLATGTGIAPIISILKSYQIPSASYELFWGLKIYQDVYLFEEFRQFNPKICLSREQNLQVVPETIRNYFVLGRVNEVFDKTLNTKYSILDTDFYLCGRKDITESLRLFLLSKNIPQERIFFEKF